jgi:hypothetical protein
MFGRLIVVCVACCVSLDVLADCFKTGTSNCVNFSSYFGYEEQSCGLCDPASQACDNEHGINYQNNTAQSFWEDPLAEPLTGSDQLTITQGNLCVKKRLCEGCSLIPLPDNTYP